MLERGRAKHVEWFLAADGLAERARSAARRFFRSANAAVKMMRIARAKAVLAPRPRWRPDMFNAHGYVVIDSMVKPGFLTITFKKVNGSLKQP